MKHLILAALAALSCNVVLAADDFSPYVSTSIGVAHQKYTGNGASLSDDNAGAQFVVGYRGGSPVFGLDGFEFGYTTFGSAKMSGNGAALSSRPRAFHGALTGTWNVAPQIAVTGKIGIANSRTRVSGSLGGFGTSTTLSHGSMVFGIGASYALAPNLALIAQYQNFGKVASDDTQKVKAQIFTVGSRFEF